MRKELNLFVDPKSHEPLEIKVEKARDGHVISGMLYNQFACYPILNSIPRFVDRLFYENPADKSGENQTAWSFGNKWNDKRHQRLGFEKKDFKSLKEQFLALLGCQTMPQLKKVFRNAKRTLNAGCGVAWSEYLFNTNPETERHCLDISLSVETAYKMTKDLKNTVVSQASILSMPYPDGIFDVVYSLGVIHHMPDPLKAFKILVQKLAPKGRIGIYIYNKKPLVRELADRQIRALTTKMDYKTCMEFSKKITKLGESLNKITQPLIIKKNIELLGVKKGAYSIHQFIYNYFLKCWYNPEQDIKYANLVNQDWYHPYYASHHTKEEVLSWFKDAGIRDITYMQPRGWEHSGYFVSGVKR
jgi:SAM-dependent methyltransferase